MIKYDLFEKIKRCFIKNIYIKGSLWKEFYILINEWFDILEVFNY